MEGNIGFESLKLNRQLLEAIEDAGYSHPTEVQKKVIPKILGGQDVIGIAPTGTGKTAAFALPILMKVKYAQGSDPRVIVLAPSKELVLQIEKDFKDLAVNTDLRIISIYGGVGPTKQIDLIKDGVDIIISTPGRFLDLYKREAMPVRSLQIMVLDEADKMMDMGFMHQIRSILEVIPVKRQNLLFSATMSSKVEELSHEFLDFPSKIEVAPQATTAETIEQVAYFVPNLRTKINLLEYLLTDPDLNRVIVFTKKRKTADDVFKYIERKELAEARVIHANKGQNTRINAMNEFKDGDIRILVTTDVSSRGIDVSDVSHVINFDVPIIHEDYVHRIGRTGRAFKAGKSITFFNDAEKYHLKKIEDLIRKKIPVSKLPAGVEITDTPKEERQDIAREIDHQKKKENPDYKGAFHEKKRKFHSSKKSKFRSSKGKRKR